MTNNNILKNLIIAKLVWLKKENYYLSFDDFWNYLNWYCPTWNTKNASSFFQLINQININSLINYLNWEQTVNSENLLITINKISTYNRS